MNYLVRSIKLTPPYTQILLYHPPVSLFSFCLYKFSKCIKLKYRRNYWLLNCVQLSCSDSVVSPASTILYYIVVDFQLVVYKISSHGIKPPLLVKVIGLVVGGRGDLRPIITRSAGNSVLPTQQWTQQRLFISIYSVKIVPLAFFYLLLSSFIPSSVSFIVVIVRWKTFIFWPNASYVC